MRKAIIAAIVATALFAVGAFAAEFAFEAEDIASGQDSVLACAEAVEVEFETDWNDTLRRYDATLATFRFTDGDGTTTASCNGLVAEVRIERDDDDSATGDPDDGDDYVNSTAVTNGDITVGSAGTPDLAGGPWAVTSIDGAAVLIDGIFIDTLGDLATPTVTIP